MKEELHGKIVAIITITIIKRTDDTRAAHSQIVGPLSELVTAIRLTAEQSREFKRAVTSAVNLIHDRP